MKRSRVPAEPICHWCKQDLPGRVLSRWLTSPAFTDWPGLPSGTGVPVCGPNCPQRPGSAPVGTRFGGDE